MKLNRPLVIAAYLTLALLVCLPLLEVTLAVWPFRPGTASWRFGAAGVFSRALMLPLFGLLLASGLALGVGNRRTLRFISVVAALAAILLVVASGLFVLDAIEMRVRVTSDVRTTFDLPTLMALLKMWSVGLAGVVLAIGAWKASRRTPGERQASAKSQQPQLIREMVRP